MKQLRCGVSNVVQIKFDCGEKNIDLMTSFASSYNAQLLKKKSQSHKL